jgi:hypothetical protein
MKKLLQIRHYLLFGLVIFVLSAGNPALGQTWWRVDTHSTDWFDPTNWSSGVPDANTDVIIPVNIPFMGHQYPIITPGQNCYAKSVNIVPLASLTMIGGRLTIFTNFVNTGTFLASPGSMVTLAGLGDQEIQVTSPTHFFDLTFAGTGLKHLNPMVWIDNDLNLTGPVKASINVPFVITTNRLLFDGIPQAAGIWSGDSFMGVATWINPTWFDGGGLLMVMVGCTEAQVIGNPVDQTVTYGGDATFTVNATGDGLTYQWEEGIPTLTLDPIIWTGLTNTGKYSGVNSETLTITRPGVGMTGLKYRCLVKASCGPIAASDGNATLTVNPLDITGTFTADNKVYDGNNSATILTRSLVGVLVPDVVELTGGVATFDNEDAGIGKIVTMTGGTLAGADAINYNLTGVATTTADITPLGITGTFTAENKEYDGNTDAVVLTRGLVGVISPDVVTLIGGTATFDTKNVGTGKIVTLTGATLSGADAGNYELLSVATTTADITPKELTVTGAVAQDKVYDGNTLCQVLGWTLVGVISPDIVILNHVNGIFAQSDVGQDIPVAVMPMIIMGPDAGNYTIAQPVLNPADITEKPITVTVTAGQHKIYGDPDPVFAYTVDPALIEGDLFTGALAREAGTNIGAYEITQGSLTAGTNYDITFVGNDFTIISKPITVTAVATTKVYDHNTVSDGIPTIAPALVAGDLPEFIQVYATHTAGTGKTLIPSGTVIDGNGGLNYQITFVNSTAGVITPLELLGRISVIDKVYDGTTLATIVIYGLDGVIPDDYVTYGGGVANFENPDVEQDKPVLATGLSLFGADAPNYTVNTTATDVASITRITAVTEVAANPANVQYSDMVTLTATIPGGAPSAGLVAAQTVTFSIGGQIMKDHYNNSLIPLVKSGVDLVATLTTQLTETLAGAMTPGGQTVQAVFNGANSNFALLPNPGTTTLAITRENATAAYDGDVFVVAPSGGRASVVLKALVQDITADPDGDDYAGDISKATVSFVNRRTNAVIGTAPVTLLSPSDPKAGMAEYTWTNVPQGDYVVGIVVGNYYERDHAMDNAIVQVYQTSGAYMTGGGKIVPNQSSGQYSCTQSKITNFAFDVAFDEAGAISHGHATVLLRKATGDVVKSYEIKSNLITKVQVNIDNPAALKGGITGEATLTDISNPLAPVEVATGLIMKLTYTDRGATGTTDGVGISLYEGTTLYYSSCWKSSATDELILADGNLVVVSSFNLDGGLNTGIGDDTIGSVTGLTVYPNPTSGLINFTFNVARGSMTTLDILSVNGELVTRVFEGYVDASTGKTITYDSNLPQGIYFYRLKTSEGVKNGKIIVGGVN